VTACREHEPLVAARLAGEISPADAARLEAHLAGCAACRDEVLGCEAALDLARLPPVSDAERRAMAPVAAATLAALGGRSRRRAASRRWVVGVALAAAAAVALLSPALLRRAPPPPVTTEQPTAVASADDGGWQEPDLDEIWEDTGILPAD
jgi:anti-sigma factor RsiW